MAATKPSLASAQPATPAPDVVTADALGVAQQLIGIELPPVERESARPLVSRNRDNYASIRKVAVPSDTEPAFSFRPPRPRADRNHPLRAPGSRRALPRGQGRARPSSIEDLAFAPVTTLASLIASRRVSSTELTTMYLGRLKRFDPTLHCVVTLTEDIAMAQAAEADREIRAGRYRGPLHGIPYGIKDLFAARGVLTTWGAKPYADQIFDYDSTVVARLREAGAVLVAKLSTGELAVGDLWFRARTRNPWDPEHGSSGSSAGPAAATSA
ncbi:MAG: amidase family protein, partial [Vicinamibacterales bacterium]